MSGVKVTNEQHPRPIANDFDGVSGTDDGDDNFSWDPGITTEIPPGNDTGDVLTWDGDSWEPEPPAAGTREWELWNEGGDPLLYDMGNLGSTETIDPTNGNVQIGTLDANCTVTLDTPSGTAATLELWLTQDGTGGRVITWSGTVSEIGSPTTTAGTTNIAVATTKDGGTSWVVAWVGAGEPVADAHIADTTDAHDASAISIADAGGYYTGTDVEAALQEIPALIAATATGGGHAHVVEETHLSDGSTTTWTLDQAYEPGSVIAWNITTIARLLVTEVPPDRATVSAAGSSGDKIVFDYAATLA